MMMGDAHMVDVDDSHRASTCGQEMRTWDDAVLYALLDSEDENLTTTGATTKFANIK
jgi:hypothetical protein